MSLSDQNSLGNEIEKSTKTSKNIIFSPIQVLIRIPITIIILFVLMSVLESRGVAFKVDTWSNYAFNLVCSFIFYNYVRRLNAWCTINGRNFFAYIIFGLCWAIIVFFLVSSLIDFLSLITGTDIIERIFH